MLTAADLRLHVVEHARTVTALALPVASFVVDRDLVLVAGGRRIVRSMRVFASEAVFRTVVERIAALSGTPSPLDSSSTPAPHHVRSTDDAALLARFHASAHQRDED